MPQPTTLHGAIAVITGATSGIGLAIARDLAAQGSELFLVGRNRERLNEARNAIAKHGSVAVTTINGDLESDADIEATAAAIEAKSDRVDILVHCAGWISPGALAAPDDDALDRHFRVNARAPLVLTRALLPLLTGARGQIVFVNSSVANRTKEGVGAYAASKHALRAIADTLRDELNPLGVRITSVYPGNTATPMQAAIQAATGKRLAHEYLLQPEDVASVVVNALLLPRSAEVTDIYLRPFRKPS